MTERVGEKTVRDTEHVSQVIVFNKNKKILIMKRSDICEWEPNRWALPGGHVEEGESFPVAGERETKEEAGIDVINIRHFDNPDREKETLHFFKPDFEGDDDDVKINFEHSDYAWISKDDLEDYDIVDSTKKLLKRVFTS